MADNAQTPKKCLNCGSSNLDNGRTTSLQHTLFYRSERAKDQGFWGRHKFGEYDLESALCLDCGFVHTFAKGNFEELK
ncbi:MAG: hypothetical protein ACI81T_001924 [Bacteroidia bacterium]|jgi:hypothetical protein